MINLLFNNMIFCWGVGLFLILSAIFLINLYAKDNIKQFIGYLGIYLLLSVILTTINVLFTEIHWAVYVYLFYSSSCFGISTGTIDIAMRKRRGM